MTPSQVLPSNREARFIFTKLPSRIRRSLNDLAAASGCPTLEIVQRFHQGAGHPEFPDPPSTAASIASAVSKPATASKAAAGKPRSRAAKSSSK